ncbi:MAG: hypothetical protein KAH16_00680, partial [Candidatus Izimaplasma sp.]|nr:hypothetical protein [Candidatus Izimaplasma bacterium]
MNKSILIRGSIIMGIFLVIIGAAVGCSMIKKDDSTPQISNPDEVYLQLDDLDVTKQELWDVMKNVDGLGYLMDYVDEIILKDYIDVITQDEVDEEILLLTYLTNNEELIAEIKEDPEVEQDYIDAFRQNLVIMGYDPDDTDDLRSFVELSIAKVKYLEEYVSNADVDSYFAIDADDIEDYYTQTEYNDACVVEVRFSSTNEASLVFDLFNLVPNYNTGFGLYTGVDPIEDIASDDFDETNTTQLTDEEVFTKFIEMYNYMNPWMPQIPTNIEQADYCTDYSDVATYSHEDMTFNKQQGDPNIEYAVYLFDTLDLTREDIIQYSYNVQSIGTASLIAYKISEEPRTDFEDLTTQRVDELIEELAKFYVTEGNIEIVMKEKRDEVGLEIFDPLMKLKYKFDAGVSYDNEGDKSIIATFGDVEITADDLYEYMEARVGTFYSIELTKVKWLVQSADYVDVYGDERDYMNNKTDKMAEHRDELRTIKSTFSGNGYASYGFSSNEYTWEEFLFLAFTATTENKVLEQLFVVPSIQPSLIYPSLEYSSVSDFITEQVDNYFSLNVIHILMYVDYDNDFEPDSFDDLLADFDAAEETEFNLLKVAFENLILDKYTNDNLSTEQIVDEFQDSLIDDVDNEWAIFKQYGFKLMTEPLSLDGGSINYINSSMLDESFKESLKRIYDVYVRPENEDLDEYVDTQLTTTDFGLHLIIATPGSNFEQPTAFFEVDAANPDAYSNGSANTEVTP